MSSVPGEIAGIGSTAMRLRVSPGFDPLKAQVGPDEYFVLSRIDGTQTLRDVLLSTGLSIERGIAIVTKLRSIGALLLPGETSAPMPAAVPAKPSTPRISAATPSAPMTPPRGTPVLDIGRAPTTVAVQTPGSTPAISRTPTPITPLPHGSRLPAQQAPSIARTTTPATPMPVSKMPARPPAPIDVDPPTQPRMQIDPPTQPRAPVVAPGTTRGAWPEANRRPPAADAFDGPTVRRAPSADINIVLPAPTQAERAALAEPGEIGADQRLRILALARLVDARDPWALLGVPAGANANVLKRAYFKLSKEIHPDRFFGKQLGSFADRLSVVFEAIARAYAKLTTPDKVRPTGAHQAVGAEQPQTPQEYAGELFERACGLEVGGDAMGAMKLFAAAVRINPQTRYLRRAATCALAAEQPKTALEYAKKAQTLAPHDPSSARLLAAAFRACGRLSDAEEVLVMAMALKSENDVLTAELRNDLNEVRRLLSS